MPRANQRTRTVCGISRVLATCAALAVVAATAAAGEQQPPTPTNPEMKAATELIERVVERYESERSYRISFRQETYWALADTTIASDGVLLLERPSMLAIRYDDGSSIASNGDTLWVYVAQTNQFFLTAVDADDTVIDPPRVLRQYVPNSESPFVGAPEGVVGGGTANATLSLVPASGSGEPARLEVTVDLSRSVVTEMVAHTRTGDHTRYIISENLFGVDTSPADFAITIPPGAERIGG